MTSETDNLPTGGTDNAHPPTAIDHPDNLNFFEPDEESDNQGDEEEGTETDSETDEADDEGQESGEAETADETEAEAEAEGEEGEEPEASEAPEVNDDILVPVDGKNLPLGEVKAGYMRQADYSRKTQELGNKRRDLDALSARVNKSVDAIATFLSQQIPPMPDASVSMTDPGRYVREKAMHEAAMQQVNAVLASVGDVKDVTNKLTDEQHSELITQEKAKLAEAFPSTASPEGFKQFFDTVSPVARELGYSDEEIAQATDHRMFKLAHYARLGFQAEKAKAKAVTKVANVPPVTPQKRPQGQNSSKARTNQEAMKKLNRTGSIHDAMKIDFD